MRTSISFFPNVAKRNARSERIPIYLRVLHNGQKAEARLNEDISIKDLPKWNPVIMRLDARDAALNSKLNSISKAFDDFKIINGTKLHLFNARHVRDLLTGSSATDDPQFYNYVNSYYHQAVASNSRLSEGTKKNYIKAIKHLSRFLSQSNKETMAISGLNPQFVTEFWDYLLSDCPKQCKKGMTAVSASGIIKKFRTIFDRAVVEGTISRNPFKVLKLKTKSPMRQKLTVSELLSWYRSDLTAFPALEVYKDIFLFGCLTGLAFSDIMSLKPVHLKQAGDEVIIRKERCKTGELIEIMLTSFAKKVIEKYLTYPEKRADGSIFPGRSLNACNYHDRIIADKLGITTKVTTHIARHTFRQLLAEAGISDFGVIKRMMGQSRRGDIDEVYYQITESRLLDAKTKFEVYLKHYLTKDI